MHIEEIINRFNGVKPNGEKAYICKCSAHSDSKPSLSIAEKDDKILMNCFAGCDLHSILASVGLTEKDLFNNKENIKPHIVAEYVYRDEKGNPLYKAIRFEPKEFRQAHLENGKWIFKMAGFDNYVPYNLPKIVKSDVVYFVEGEKDVDNLKALGLCGATTISGSKSFNKQADKIIKWFKDKTVYVLPDNDEPGEKYAKDVISALQPVVKNIKKVSLNKAVKDLKKGGDFSDVLAKLGKEETLKILSSLINDEIKVDSMVIGDLMNVKFFEKLHDLEENEKQMYLDVMSKINTKFKSKEVSEFAKEYKKYFKEKEKKSKVEILSTQGQGIYFEGLSDKVYNCRGYYVNNLGYIFGYDKNGESKLISYQPILPIEILENVENKEQKVKLAYKNRGKWNSIIVGQENISSARELVNLSSLGLKANSENAKNLVKYLAEIQALNEDKIPISKSVSRMGWFENKLVPYTEEIQFDREKDAPKLKEGYKEKGTLEEWVNFFKEKRKKNPLSRIAMAASVTSIILKDLKQNSFTVHFYGGTGFGKTVLTMAATSMFGHPEDIKINFNATMAGIEDKLDMHNNIPVFMNEMQHRDDEISYDKFLYLVAEMQGKTRSTKGGGNARQRTWQNIVITNGERDIIKDYSQGGAINRVLSFELEDYSFDNLPEVADFSKEHYGTAIREIIKHLSDFDLKKIYNEKLKLFDGQDTSDKQKILKAMILVGDKIVVDTLFKDGLYLTVENFVQNNIRKEDVDVGKRAFTDIQQWYISEKSHFEDDKFQEKLVRDPIYGRIYEDGFVGVLKNILSNKLKDFGFDANEVYKIWKKEEYTRCEERRVTARRVINNEKVACILLNINRDEENKVELQVDYSDELPF